MTFNSVRLSIRFSRLSMLLMLFCSRLNADPFILAGTDQLPLSSEITAMEHRLVVSLPGSYASSPKQYYPTLYFLDAYWDMPLVYATVGNLNFDRKIPEVILVGLSVPDEVAKTPYRDRFFSPIAKPTEPHTGQAALFYKMLTEEVIPFIENRYRATSDPAQRALAGQSMGGLFNLFALHQTPRFFSRFIAINPAVSWNTQFLLDREKKFAKHYQQHPARVFISYGEHEYAPFRDATKALIQQMQSAPRQGLNLQIHQLRDMYHTGGKGEAYARGLLWVFKDIAPQGKSGLELIW